MQEHCSNQSLFILQVPKPLTLYDILKNLRQGKYEVDLAEVRHDTRVILPAVEDLEQYG